MKATLRPVILAILIVVLISLLLSGLTDTTTSIADISPRDNEITTSQSEASNSPASVKITITMYAVADE